jgi:hypothetical protein
VKFYNLAGQLQSQLELPGVVPAGGKQEIKVHSPQDLLVLPDPDALDAQSNHLLIVSTRTIGTDMEDESFDPNLVVSDIWRACIPNSNCTSPIPNDQEFGEDGANSTLLHATAFASTVRIGVYPTVDLTSTRESFYLTDTGYERERSRKGSARRARAQDERERKTSTSARRARAQDERERKTSASARRARAQDEGCVPYLSASRGLTRGGLPGQFSLSPLISPRCFCSQVHGRQPRSRLRHPESTREAHQPHVRLQHLRGSQQ